MIPQNANSESTTSITQTTSTVTRHFTMSTQATTSSTNSTGTVMTMAPQELNLPVAPPPRFHTPRYRVIAKQETKRNETRHDRNETR